MEESGIPINASDLPINAPTLEDDLIYEGTLEKVAIALKLDKNDNIYCSVKCSIVNNDVYEGLDVTLNYLRLPIPIAPDAGKKLRVRAQVHNAPFGRFVKAFKLKGVVPEVNDVRNNEQREKFTQWIESFYGNQGAFSVSNEEFPVGSGRMSSKIKDFTT